MFASSSRIPESCWTDRPSKGLNRVSRSSLRYAAILCHRWRCKEPFRGLASLSVMIMSATIGSCKCLQFSVGESHVVQCSRVSFSKALEAANWSFGKCPNFLAACCSKSSSATNLPPSRRVHSTWIKGILGKVVFTQLLVGGFNPSENIPQNGNLPQMFETTT